jgi:tetratricopeptide (TPR) repeat protein
LIPLLRAVVAAAPRFANGWANLAETLAVTIPSPAADRDAVAREADAAAGTALAIDPRTAKAYVVKAWTRLPLFPVTGPDLFPAFRDFRGWQADVDKSLTVRPSDCGCEVIEYGFALTQLGRASAAIPYFERGAAGQSYGWEADAYRAYALALDGRAEQAKSILDGLAAKWPDVKALTLLRLHAALWRRDWASAQALLPEAPESAAKQPLLELVRALAKGDRAGVADSARALKALAAQGEPLDFLTPWGLAIAGLPDDAVAAADRVLATSGTPGMQGLFVPTFAQARRTPAFGRLVERTGIIDYWRQPGHRPDFCKPADAPPLCATL